MKEFSIRDQHQLGVQWLSQNELSQSYGINGGGAILSEAGASVDAYQLTHALMKLNVQRGLQLYDQTTISSFEFKKDQTIIHLENKKKVTCRKLIFCTGFEATEMLKEKVAKLYYTYACVSEQGIQGIDAIKNNLVWTTDEPYLYLRCTDDNRLLAGGEDSRYKSYIFQQSIKEKKSDAIIKKLEKLIPGILFKEDFSWGGVFGETKDGLPYIGITPEYPDAIFVLGFGGNGITFSVQAMDMVTALLSNEVHPLSKYYAFGR